jgi:hypothetical protein
MFLYKWPLKDYLWPIFAICMFIFHKTEFLKVILRCWTGLDYDWCKSYDKKCKYFHFFFFAILYKNTCLQFWCFLCFCVLCHNFCTSYMVAFVVGLKCLRKVHLNTQCPPLWLRNTWMVPYGNPTLLAFLGERLFANRCLMICITHNWRLLLPTN